ncbi:hypothetical protein GCM10011430_14150 [Oxalicibacterium solurbis]|uniref:Uncharacterized protein n=1 Tax=Oxalicibacterium solurbis TaxID=69280 RepID=A0A8J3F659_9BURK|nr:hypothetical protein GCM10011430_14150 [Oxalicibacterium solurbis]
MQNRFVGRVGGGERQYRAQQQADGVGERNAHDGSGNGDAAEYSGAMRVKMQGMRCSENAARNVAKNAA